MNGYGRQRECDGHQNERNPKIPEPFLIVWKPPSEEVKGHWMPTGAEPMERWMDGSI